jgi:hypothetical protein
VHVLQISGHKRAVAPGSSVQSPGVTLDKSKSQDQTLQMQVAFLAM